MKVTALVPDTLIHDLRRLTQGETLTESLIFALEAWVRQEKIKALNQLVSEAPLSFTSDFSAENNRHLNRRR